MSISEMTDVVLTFVKDHEAAAAPIVFLLAFGESFAFISLLLPATVILWGVGALIGASGLNFWPLWAAAVVGAGLGDWISYWIGLRYHHQILHVWPFRRFEAQIEKGLHFLHKWGTAAIFLGRFTGPLRATVPLRSTKSALT